MTGGPVAWMRVFVGMTSNLVTYEALVVAHVLSMLGRGESDGIHSSSRHVIIVVVKEVRLFRVTI